MVTRAEDLTQSGYKQLRDKVAGVLAGDGYQGVYSAPEASDYLAAERLIDAGYIDVDKVLGLPS